jgi:hypothetical protein
VAGLLIVGTAANGPGAAMLAAKRNIAFSTSACPG